jgi:hypothetical protein
MGWLNSCCKRRGGGRRRRDELASSKRPESKASVLTSYLSGGTVVISSVLRVQTQLRGKCLDEPATTNSSFQTSKPRPCENELTWPSSLTTA